jgi:ubiquinone/menaquinone biosynthesis C-methylase UbiE
MTETVYDRNVQRYLDFLDGVLAAEPSLFRILLDELAGRVGPRLEGASVLDLACGEGYVGRAMAERGAAHVVGVDLSSELIAVARERTTQENVSFVLDDAQTLASQPDDSFDVVVSQMAMMDIADHLAVLHAVARVLKPGGVFAFSMLHPCFQAPCHEPDRPAFLLDDDGARLAIYVWTYANEGHWWSGSTGIRGTMGSNHRMLSTYLNDLIATGFAIERIAEPVVPAPGLLGEVPLVMVVAATLVA